MDKYTERGRSSGGNLREWFLEGAGCWRLDAGY